MPSSPAVPHRRPAASSLPTAGDLWGTGWVEDRDELTAGAGAGGPDECLPASFPDAARVDEADVTFVDDGRSGLVYAVATVFADAEAAHAATDLLSASSFLDCFAASVAGDVVVPEPTELLGPVETTTPTPSPSRGAVTSAGSPAAPATDGPGTAPPRVRSYRASFAGTDSLGMRPVVLTIAVIGHGDRVVLVAGVNRPGPSMERGWARLVTRVVARVTHGAVPGAT